MKHSPRWNDAALVEETIWTMRLADLPRGENRAVLNRLYNGEPPYSEEMAEENNIQINRSDLEGVNILAQARRQWNNAFLKPGNYFTVTVDAKPPHKAKEWSHTITKHLNHELKRSRKMLEQTRAVGGNAVLHGMGPVNWEDRYNPVPMPLPIPSVMIPSETLLDFDNLEYIAFFREATPSQIYEKTHGPRVDPGWNMDVVDGQYKYIREEVLKQPNSTAFQYMPERIEELVKQDLGFWGSDAVPTVDYWDFLFRNGEDGKGWYRRAILDWGVGASQMTRNMRPPTSRNKDKNGKSAFLYTSGEREYASSLEEFFHCQMADCSAVFPQTYHSIRSLGWMEWGICDLQNRLHCKFNENVFQSLLWWFRTASNQDLIRLKQASFAHMAVIPTGVDWVKSQDRYTPNAGLIQMAFGRNQQLMAQSAASFVQDFEKGGDGKERTATEVMAQVNQVNALVSGMLNLAYTYEEFKYQEQCRRFCIENSRSAMVRRFRKNCLRDGVPPEILDSEKWEVHAERVLGGGNKTLEMAQANFLLQNRKNLGPDAQRKVDHIAIEAATDDPDLAEELAPVEGQKQISNSQHDAQLATERLMRGLPFVERADMVYEDYVKQWIADLAILIQEAENLGGMASQAELIGFSNMAQHIEKFLGIMGQDKEDKERVKGYQNALAKLMNHVKAFAQRLKEQMTRRNGAAAGGDGGAAAKAQGAMLMAQVKAKNAETSHAQRTAQKQVSFELEEQRRDRESAADIRRKAQEHALDMTANRLRMLQEPETPTESN